MRINKTLLMIVLMLVTFSCSSKKTENTPDPQPPDETNSAMSKISQVVGLGKIEPETKILSLASSGGGIISSILKSNGDREKPERQLLSLIQKLKELRTELRKAQIDLNRRNLTAPVDGTVLNILVTTGSSINQFSEFCEFAPDGKTIARCEIDEMFADRVKEGQSAEITLVGNNTVIANGKVVRTAPYLKRKSLFSELPGDREDRRVREVWIMLDSNDGLLFNMQVECKITI